METEQSSSCLTFSWLPISFLSCFYLCLKSKPQPRFSYNINEVSKQPRKCVVKIEFLWGVFTAKNQHYYEQFSFSFFLEEKLFLLSEALWDTGLSSKPWKLIKEKKKRKKEKSNYFYQNFDTQRGKVRFEANLNEKLSREDQTDRRCFVVLFRLGVGLELWFFYRVGLLYWTISSELFWAGSSAYHFLKPKPNCRRLNAVTIIISSERKSDGK